MELNKIYHGNCIDIMQTFPTNSIDAIITDPPFAFAGGSSNGHSSITDDQFFSFWWKAVCKELSRILKPTAEGFIWCDWKTAAIIADGFKTKEQTYDQLRISQILFHYREMPGQGKPFRNSVDMIAYLRGHKSTGHRIPNTTHNMISKYWYYGKHKYHPSEKDVDICQQLVKWCSDEKMTIIDPFCGSGTTTIACTQTNRNYIGIDREDDYCHLSNKRLKGTSQTLQLT